MRRDGVPRMPLPSRLFSGGVQVSVRRSGAAPELVEMLVDVALEGLIVR